MARTASTISGVSFSARVWLSFVERDVRATHSRSSRSTSLDSLNSSRNYRYLLEKTSNSQPSNLPSKIPSWQSRSHL